MADKTCSSCKHYRIQIQYVAIIKDGLDPAYMWWCDLEKENCDTADCPDWEEDA